MSAIKLRLCAVLAILGMLGGCYFDRTFSYHVNATNQETPAPWRLLSDGSANNISSNLIKPGLDIHLYMGARLKKPHIQNQSWRSETWTWDGYKVVGRPFPVAIIIQGGSWAGEEQFDILALDEKKIFLVRNNVRFPARLLFSVTETRKGEVKSRYQLEFDTALQKNDRFHLLMVDALRANNKILSLPAIDFEGDPGHFEWRSFSDLLISH